jgi:hypothetical protein
MIEALLLVLAIGHYGYAPAAAALGVSEPRIFYLFQGLIGAAFFGLAGLVLYRKAWPVAVRSALQLVALAGVAEQLLVVGCGTMRLYEPIFRAPKGEGLCGRGWYGVGLAVLAWLAVIVWSARYGQPDR